MDQTQIAAPANRDRPAPRACTFLLIAACLCPRSIPAQQVGRTPVEVQILTPPTALFALGRWQMVYELHLSNLGTKPLDLLQVDALDPTGVVLGSWKEASLAARILALGAPPKAPGRPQNSLEVLKQAPGSGSIAYIWITLPVGMERPVTIHHRLIYGTLTRQDTLTTASRMTDVRLTPTLEVPVSDGPWVAIRGPANSSGHRLSLVTIDGETAIPQRYAIDWAKLGPDGKLFHGDSTVATNWYGYGAPITAAAAGTVIWARIGVTEHPALTLVSPAIIEAEEALGNAIILDIGEGRYATYAHLKPGSVRVKVGDKVAPGQPIAELGNTGNSLAPHLHFHVSNSPKPLGGEGMPYTLPSFELVGRVASSASLLNGLAWTADAAQPARMVDREMPLENMVVRFGR